MTTTFHTLCIYRSIFFRRSYPIFVIISLRVWELILIFTHCFPTFTLNIKQ